MKRNHRISNSHQPRTEQEQREVAADALRRAATEVRRLEEMRNDRDGESDRAY